MFGRKKSLARRDRQRARAKANRSKSVMSLSSSASESHLKINDAALKKTRFLISSSAKSEAESLSSSVSNVIRRASDYSQEISRTAIRKMSAANYVYTSIISSADSSIQSSLANAKSKLSLAHQNALHNAYISASSATASAINLTPLSETKRRRPRVSYQDSSLESTLSKYGNVYQATRNINREVKLSGTKPKSNFRN